MTYIELPRALEDYFAFAEIDPTRNGRRFSISMPYFDGERLERLQWWYHLSRDQQERSGEAILVTLRAQATERFRRHIERWLQNTGRRLYGQEPIPRIGSVTTSVPALETPAPLLTPAADPSAPAAETLRNVAPWPTDRVVNA
jgi:hypothetical protein